MATEPIHSSVSLYHHTLILLYIYLYFGLSYTGACQSQTPTVFEVRILFSIFLDNYSFCLLHCAVVGLLKKDALRQVDQFLRIT